MKGQGLPITYLIVILLAVIVAVGVIMFWTGGFGSLTGIFGNQTPGNQTQIQVALSNFERDCTNWKNAGCVGDAPDIGEYLNKEQMKSINKKDYKCKCPSPP